MNREQLEIRSTLDDLLIPRPVTASGEAAQIDAVLAYVIELIEQARAAERQVCVDVAARMAHDAMAVRRLQRGAAMSRVAEALKNGVRR